MAVIAEITGSPMGFFIRAPSALGAPPPIIADNIDPRTRDFASILTGADAIDAQVQLAVTTQRGSGAAVVEDGIKISTNKMTAALPDLLEADARLALRRLVRMGDIQIVGVNFDFIEDGDQFAQMRIQYINLRAADGTVRTSNVPLRVPTRVV